MTIVPVTNEITVVNTNSTGLTAVTAPELSRKMLTPIDWKKPTNTVPILVS
jgi:hypothetical protein